MELHFFTGKQAGFEQAAAIRQAVFVEEQGFHNEFDEIDENAKTVVIQGENGRIPNNEATINVRSAGTAARFMTVLLAVCGGKYTLESSEQMKTNE